MQTTTPPRSRALVFTLLASAVFIPGCTDPAGLQRFEYRQRHMGTEARIVLFAADAAAAERAAAAAYQRIAELDAALSDFRLDSEVAALAAHAGGPALHASHDLVRVLARALELARATDGAFDPTAGPLVRLWRQTRRSGRLPDPAALEHARSLTGWRLVRLDSAARTVRLERRGMGLDFGAIGKGYALDEALAVLRANGVPVALLTLGGDILAGDPPPGLQGWPVRIENAAAADGAVALANRAIATSGDTEQFVEIDGTRYSHVIDPRSGRPLTGRIAATVEAPDATSADALATALTVLDSVARARLLAQHPQVRARIRRLPPG